MLGVRAGMVVGLSLIVVLSGVELVGASNPTSTAKHQLFAFDPYGVAFDSNTGTLYTTNYPGYVSVISDANNSLIKRISDRGGGPVGLAYDSQNGDTYVADVTTGNVTVISSVNYSVVKMIPVGFGSMPVAVAYDSHNSEIYVANTNGPGSISVISGFTNTVIKTIPEGIPYGTNPAAVAYDSDNNNIYVANYGGGYGVAVISDATNSIIKNISNTDGLGGSDGIGVDPDNGNIYVSDYGGGDCLVCYVESNVTIISGSNNSVLKTIEVGWGPTGIACDSANGDLYVVTANNVTVISGMSDTVVASIPVEGGPNGIAYDPSDGDIYVTNGTSGVSVISGASNTVISTINLSLLSSVSVSPSTTSVGPRENVTFAATLRCVNGTCPTGTIYSWNLTNHLGTLGLSNESTVEFKAGNGSGEVTLIVNATLEGKTVSNSATITIVKPTPHSSTSPSSQLLGSVVAMVVGVAASGVALALALWRSSYPHRFKMPSHTESAESVTGPKPPESPQTPPT